MEGRFNLEVCMIQNKILADERMSKNCPTLKIIIPISTKIYMVLNVIRKIEKNYLVPST